MLVGEKSNRFHFGISYSVGSSSRNVDIREEGKSSSKIQQIFFVNAHKVPGTVLGSGLPAGSGGFKEADAQESTQLASSKIHRPGLHSSSQDCRSKSLKGETSVG